MKKQPSIKELEQQVEKFNKAYPVGDKVTIQTSLGVFKEVTVKNPASVLGGHSAVGWFKEISGCYDLSKVIYPF